MSFMFFRFRPSSHSETYTIIVNLKSRGDAKRLYRQLIANADRLPLASGGQAIVRNKQTVSVNLYVPSRDDADRLARTIKRKNKGAECTIVRERESFLIEGTLPEGLTLNSPILPLILDSKEYEGLRELAEICQVEQRGNKIIFKYEGEDAWAFYDRYGFVAANHWIIERKSGEVIVIPESWKNSYRLEGA